MTANVDRLRRVAVAAGVAWSVVFVAAGVGFGLQLYGDGAMFSYAVAVQEAWAFHLHNIAARLTVYLHAFLPPEILVGLSGSARGGIILYGLLFYGAQALGLAVTFAADRSRQRIIFAYACASTACLCPLVFGFPTEMWMAHALFWPALAICHYGGRGMAATAALFAVLLALVLTHEGAVVFALAILATLALRGLRDPAFLRAAGTFAVAMTIWGAVKASFPADAYYASIISTAIEKFVDPANLTTPAFLVLAGAVVGYGVLLLLPWRILRGNAPIVSAAIVAVALAAYWLWIDRWLLTDNRYELRTLLLIVTPALGGLAAAYALRADGRPMLPVPLLPRLLNALSHGEVARAAVGAIALIVLVHAVETAKFVTAWNAYTAAVRALAMGTAADPALGYAEFVSSARIGADLNRLSWFSTTPYLSVLVAPGFAPRRLVVDPDGGYYWLTCDMAKANEAAARAIPMRSRRLVRIYSCLHR